MQSDSIPSVFILNLSYTGLGIARSLAGKGIKIYGIGSKKWACGNFSKYINFYLSPDSLTESEELYQFLVALAEKENQRPVIFPTRDHDVIFLDNYREKLEPYFLVAQPVKDILDRVVNKWKLFEVASECKVLTPKTYLINREAELRELGDTIEYPVLIKPLHSVDWRKSRIWEIVGKRKVIYSPSKKVLWEEYNKFKHIHPVILLQKYVEGEDDDIYTFCSYCDRNSNILVSFNTQKIVQMPEKLGTGIVVQSTVNDDIAECSKRLLKHIGFTGISEIEYKKDPTNGNYYLIEVNPRFWDQHQLSKSFGVNLPLIVYYDLIDKSIPVLPFKFHKTTWIAEDSLIQYLFSMLLRNRKKLIDGLYKIHGKKNYAIWSKKDPLPIIVSMVSVMIDMTKQAILKAL